MTNREALSAALDRAWPNVPIRAIDAPIILAAARERLTQLPETCGNCGGKGQTHDDPNCYACTCPVCHGSGTVHPPALVERIAYALFADPLRDLPTDHVNARWVLEPKVRWIRLAVAVFDALDGETP